MLFATSLNKAWSHNRRTGQCATIRVHNGGIDSGDAVLVQYYSYS